MAVAATVVLLVDMIAIFISTFVMVRTHDGRMAMVQLIKNMPAVTVAVFCVAS